MSRSKFPRQPPATRQRKRSPVRPLPPRGPRVFDGPRFLPRQGRKTFGRQPRPRSTE